MKLSKKAKEILEDLVIYTAPSYEYIDRDAVCDEILCTREEALENSYYSQDPTELAEDREFFAKLETDAERDDERQRISKFVLYEGNNNFGSANLRVILEKALPENIQNSDLEVENYKAP